ncbi:MAG: hypothetical protein PVF56_07850 [Desulfobacterales bacterium]
MDTIFFRDDGEPSLKIYENEPTEDNEGEMRFDSLPLLDLRDQNIESRIERRRHKRFGVDIYAFALIRSVTTKPIEIHDRGMGEIACSIFRSKPAKLGRIHNISMGGLMFRYVDSKVQSRESPVIDILLADCGYYLEGLRFRSISDLLLPNDFLGDFIQMGQLHVEFERLTPYQIAKLEYLIGEVILNSKRDIDFRY